MARFDQWAKFRHFRLMIAVVEHGSIKRASDALNLSQPSASKLLQDMEEALQAPLLARTNRGVEPTELGLEFVRHGRTILAQLDQTSQALSSLATGTAGHVAVGTLLTASSFLLPKTLAHLRRTRPAIQLKIVEGTNDQLIPRLISGELDLVVGRLSEFRHRNEVEQEPLCADAMCIVARAGHPLAGESSVPLAKLVAADWILPPSETTFRRQFDMIFHRAGFSAPQAAVESVSFLNNRLLLRETDMLGVWPRAIIASGLDTDQFVTLNTEMALPAGVIGISRRRGAVMSPAAEAVMSQLRIAASLLQE
ncbi:MAG TPA: LysR substrate-binding domain-containing protein [Sphingobium sp.]|nr:LysR substrate-binding domain-containing protein [Sphingobium sp.]